MCSAQLVEPAAAEVLGDEVVAVAEQEMASTKSSRSSVIEGLSSRPIENSASF